MKTQRALLSIAAAIFAATLGVDAPGAEERSAMLSPKALQEIAQVEAEEVVHGILDIMYAKIPYSTLQRAVHRHPTVSELIPTVLAELKPLP